MPKNTWLSIQRFDKNFHNKLSKRFPKQLSFVDKTSDYMFTFITNSAFALIAMLLLGVLVLIQKVSIVFVLSVFCAWLVAVLWFSRSEGIKKLSLPMKFIVVVVVGVLLALTGYKFLYWALSEFKKIPTTQDQMREAISETVQEATPSEGLVWPNEKQIQKRKPTKEEIEQRIILYERYPLSWPKTDGLTPLTESIKLSNGTTLKAIFKKDDDYKLGLAISNGNDGIPLTEPNIEIKLPLDVRVKSSIKWRHNNHINFRDYHTKIPVPVIYPTSQGSQGLLILEFPMAGIYHIEYIVTGMAKDIGINIQGSFNVELIEEVTK